MTVLQEPNRATSKVENRWLKSVPVDWKLTRLRFLCDVATGSGDTQDSEPRGEYDFFVRSPHPLRSSTYSYDTEAVLTAGDGAVGEVFHHVTGKFHAHQRVYVLSSFRGVLPRYFYYYFSSFFRLMAQDGSARTTVDSVRRWMLTDMPIVLPSLDEQRAIADYLEQETAQIDALVAKQEEFIGLLQERRSGLIAAGVTGRNLGDDVDDSASWIGLPPSGWLLGQVKHFGTVTLGKMLQSSDKGADLLAPYMRAANVQPDGVLDVDDVKSMWFSPRELRMLDLQSGDVVVVEGGIGGYGRAAYVAEHFDGWGFQNSINRIRPFAENDGRYLTYFLLMARQKGFISAYCNIVSMPHLTSEKLEAMPMFLPPPEVQRQIAARLDEQTARIDTLIAKAEEHIALAKERRSALITAAVTGQFDVRTVRKAG